MTYTLTATTTIIRDADQACIPDDPRNTDYQAYLAWVAEGNTPAPYVPPPEPPITLTAYQLRMALNTANLRSQVEAAVAAASIQIKDAWQYQQAFTETDPMVLQIAGVINETSNTHTVFQSGLTFTP